MHRTWESLLEPLLQSLRPRVIVEVGADHGYNTRNLLEFARRAGSLVHVIDPLPKFKVEEWEQAFEGTLKFHRSASLDALPGVEAPDVVLIDGDHNWYTVFHELRILEQTSRLSRYPVVLLHDVGWPYGRRDLYYAPDRIPEPYRHPYKKGGLRPSTDGVESRGGLNAGLFNAVRSGGPRNGVLTAVEDFLDETSSEVEFVIIPGIHDVAIVYPADLASANAAAARLIESLTPSPQLLPLLERLERLRVEAVIEASDLGLSVKERDTQLAESAQRMADLEGQLSRLVEEQGRERAAMGARVEQLTSERERERSETRAREEEIASLQSQLIRLERQIEHLTLRLSRSEVAARDARTRYRALARRRSVRLALRLAKLARPVFRGVRSLRRWRRFGRSGRGGVATVRHKVTLDDVVRGIKSSRQTPYPIDGPLVSIVVLTRNGADRMRVLLDALSRSAYQAFEVVVVDNASTDDTAEVLSLEWPFPLEVITNDQNNSFSLGNNQGVSRASGDLLLLLNNDVEPITDHWLGAMVDAMENPDPSPSAVGALLVYPLVGDPERDLTVQHRGIRFGFRDSAPHAFNLSAEDPTDPDLVGVREVPGVSAAAMLLRRDTFEAVGGFTLGYVYGAEDVDLCLKLRSEGPIVLQGDAVLFHHESATQVRQASKQLHVQRMLNWQQYAETWGPKIVRSTRRDMLQGSGRWTASPLPPKVAITLTHDDEAKGYGDYYTAHELGDALAAEGWDVHYAERYRDGWYDLPDDVVMVVGLLDSFDVRTVGSEVVRIAWVRNWVERWLERPWLHAYDIVVAGSASAAAAISRATRFAPPVIPLASNPDRFSPGPPGESLDADYAFTGNNWGVERSLTSMLEVRSGEQFALYGKGWDEDPTMKHYWRGHLDYARLRDLYRSVKVVLDDTAGPTIDHGFVNSRVFDALACGALVITNNRLGSQELFDGLLPVYEDPQTLREQLDKYLDNEGARLALVEALQSKVSDAHTYARRAAQFVDLANRVIEGPRLAVKIGAPDPETAHHWGDWHFANSLVRAMSTLGFHGEVHLLPEWDAPSHQSFDVVIHLRGLSRYRPKPSAINVLWVISHPEDLTAEEASLFDLVCVASPSLAEQLEEAVEAPVVFLPQATDAVRFGSAQPRDELRSRVLFVGNTRNQRRPAVDWAVAAGLPLTVYGLGWERKLPRGSWLGRYFPNEQLPDLYASAEVVLNDHWPDMRDHGIVSNRIFDVLAAGGVVVSDAVAGLAEMLDDAVPTYSDGGELRSLVEGLLREPDEREALAQRGRKAVLEAHTFEHRASQLSALLFPLLEGRPVDCDGNTHSRAGVTVKLQEPGAPSTRD